MLVAIADSLSDLASSDNGEDGEDEDDEETEQGKLSDDDEPGWVIVIITKMVQQRVERFWQKQMMLGEWTQPGWEEASNFFCEHIKKCGTSVLRDPAVVQLQTKDHAPAPPPTTFGDLMQYLEIVLGVSQMLQVNSRPGSSYIRLDLAKPQLNSSIPSCEAAMEHNVPTLLKVKPVEPVSCYPCI
jgi:hypothetical protein